MNASYQAILYRIFKPKSNTDVIHGGQSKYHYHYEFLNYKPIELLDPPIDYEEKEIKVHKQATSRSHINARLRINIDALRTMYIGALNKGVDFSLLNSLCHTRTLPILKGNRRVVFIDLDNTLVHVYRGPSQLNGDDEHFSTDSFISFRPYLKQFLRKVSTNYDIVIYSSGTRDYVEEAVDTFDMHRKYVSHCMCYEDCDNVKGIVVKILRGMSKLKGEDYLLIDDNIVNIMANLNNGVLIAPYIGNSLDVELIIIGEFLVRNANSADIRLDLADLFCVNDALKMISDSSECSQISV